MEAHFNPSRLILINQAVGPEILWIYGLSLVPASFFFRNALAACLQFDAEKISRLIDWIIEIHCWGPIFQSFEPPKAETVPQISYFLYSGSANHNARIRESTQLSRYLDVSHKGHRTFVSTEFDSQEDKRRNT